MEAWSKRVDEGNCSCLKSSKFYRTWGFWLRSVKTRRIDEKLVFNHPCALLWCHESYTPMWGYFSFYFRKLSLKEADEKLLKGLEWETKTSGQLGDIVCLQVLYHWSTPQSLVFHQLKIDNRKRKIWWLLGCSLFKLNIVILHCNETMTYYFISQNYYSIVSIKI